MRKLVSRLRWIDSPASGDAGSAAAVGPNVFRSQLRFRPGRSAHQAVAQAQKHIAEGYSWVVDLDLESFRPSQSRQTDGSNRKRVEDKRL